MPKSWWFSPFAGKLEPPIHTSNQLLLFLLWAGSRVLSQPPADRHGTGLRHKGSTSFPYGQAAPSPPCPCGALKACQEGTKSHLKCCAVPGVQKQLKNNLSPSTVQSQGAPSECSHQDCPLGTTLPVNHHLTCAGEIKSW